MHKTEGMFSHAIVALLGVGQWTFDGSALKVATIGEEAIDNEGEEAPTIGCSLKVIIIGEEEANSGGEDVGFQTTTNSIR